ncbi:MULTISPECIES: DNA cytosine methyltransferase [unclassified Streptomyces]|uniref:DNA cytosine methyltransferase n=1 Tax=unclassified Streptomyces TaxID=2593676 RepID=UPI0030787F94
MRTPRPVASDPITVIDLFSGCGGFTQGFHEYRPADGKGGSVFHSLAAVEHNRAAAATYAANFGELRRDRQLPAARVHIGDIEAWNPTPEALNADVVVGGPPCQGFSALNRRKKGTDRNRLWEEYVRIVADVRPKVFVIENVDRFLKSDEFKNLLSEVEAGGRLADYRLVDPPGHESTDSEEQRAKRYLLNAADYGAVQARRRAIVIGVRRDIDDGQIMAYPARTHIRPPRNKPGVPLQPLDGVDITTSYWKSVDDIFYGEAALPEPRSTELPAGKVHLPEITGAVPGIFTTPDLHVGRNPEPLSLARYSAIPAGGNRKDLRDKWFTVDDFGKIHIFLEEDPPGVRTPVRYLSTDSWDSHNTGTGDVMGRLRRGEPSVTIRTEFFKPEKGRYLHPDKDRPITHFEAALIQGFPLEFRWCGSKTEIATQIGNAVPIPLGKAIAGAVYSFLRG